ncbi:MAG: hypothetical protein ACTSP0_02465 [Alphaproteobacteria bacterium]
MKLTFRMKRCGGLPNGYECVIPAKAGNQFGLSGHISDAVLDPGLRRDDDLIHRDDDLIRREDDLIRRDNALESRADGSIRLAK